jgi:hypothetical protein
MGHVIEVREYLDVEGKSPYAKWFDRLSVAAAVKVRRQSIGWSRVTSLMWKVWVPAFMSSEICKRCSDGSDERF